MAWKYLFPLYLLSLLTWPIARADQNYSDNELDEVVEESELPADPSSAEVLSEAKLESETPLQVDEESVEAPESTAVAMPTAASATEEGIVLNGPDDVVENHYENMNIEAASLREVEGKTKMTDERNGKKKNKLAAKEKTEKTPVQVRMNGSESFQVTAQIERAPTLKSSSEQSLETRTEIADPKSLISGSSPLYQ